MRRNPLDSLLRAVNLVPMNAAIVRILSVIDTRQYIEQGDRFVPVPGSGDANECARCRRLHEVHATVELADGSRVVVGTGCMTSESLDVQRALKSGAGQAKRLAALRAELAKWERLVAEHAAIWAKVPTVPLAPVLERPWEHNPRSIELVCDGVSVITWPGDGEARKQLLAKWRNKQAELRGETYKHRVAAQNHRYCADKIEKYLAQ